MKRAAVFFDRDNTLIVADGYLGDPAGVRLVEGAAEAVARARRLGYSTVTISNQSGVARGMFTEDAVRAVNRRMDDLMKSQIPTAVIDAHEFCPYHPEGTVPQYRHESELRKPQPGMLLRAAQNLALDLGRSWVVGDAPRDIEAGHAAGCRTILLTHAGLAASPAAREPLKVEPDFTAASLTEAMDVIERHGAHRAVMPAVVPGGAAAATEGREEAEPVRTVVTAPDLSRVEGLLEEVLAELKRRRASAGGAGEFSTSHLLAGVVQIFTVAVLVLGYFGYFGKEFTAAGVFLFGIYLQTLVIALLIFGRQR